MTSRKTVSLVTLTVAGALALTACGGGHKAGELATPAPVSASLAKAEARELPQRIELSGTVEAGKSAMVSQPRHGVRRRRPGEGRRPRGPGPAPRRDRPRNRAGAGVAGPRRPRAGQGRASPWPSGTTSASRPSRSPARPPSSSSTWPGCSTSRPRGPSSRRRAPSGPPPPSRRNRASSPRSPGASRRRWSSRATSPPRAVRSSWSSRRPAAGSSSPSPRASSPRRSSRSAATLLVTLDATPGARPLPGRVVEMSPGADPASHSFTAKVDVGGALVPTGVSGRAVLETGRRTAVVVPASAVLRRAG